ncbi:MAG: triose-phosphate isomerase, partial [Pseudomonadota bacterium]
MKQLIAANWKMNGTPDWGGKVAQLNALISNPDCDILICPPHPLVGALASAAQDTSIMIGGQDCSQNSAGAHTGETDAELLAKLSAKYVILGHSERRAMGETDALIKAKSERSQDCGLRPIICVGESLDQR